jgi:thioredoxin reductase (NADPH)
VKIYDVIIIGGGPAGYTAATYSARAGLDTLIIEKEAIGGQMAITDVIDNYPGFENGVIGFELGMKMQAGAERFGAVTEYAEVTKVVLSEQIKRIYTGQKEYLARAVIVSSGASPRRLGIDGEEELTGMGVHYCAHCDGRFYKGKTVVVVGGGNTAAEDAIYLSRLAKNVILVHRRDTLRATKIYRDAIAESENVRVCYSTAVEKLVFDESLSGVTVRDLKSGESRKLECDGVFISIGRVPATELFSELERDENGYIIADESTKTNIPGVFVAGDVRTKALRQVVTAVADGAVAAYRAEEYLDI